jgi:HSP20 family molecular chaperone IbpA
MIGNSQSVTAQPVQVVEADVLDTMNETDELIAQRTYEIFQGRSSGHGLNREDWFGTAYEVLHHLAIERTETDTALQLTAHVPGFNAGDLEVAIGHGRAVICGIHSASKQSAENRRIYLKVMQIVELPFDVDPLLARATLEQGTLQVLLPRSH